MPGWGGEEGAGGSRRQRSDLTPDGLWMFCAREGRTWHRPCRRSWTPLSGPAPWAASAPRRCLPT